MRQPLKRKKEKSGYLNLTKVDTSIEKKMEVWRGGPSPLVLFTNKTRQTWKHERTSTGIVNVGLFFFFEKINVGLLLCTVPDPEMVQELIMYLGILDASHLICENLCCRLSSIVSYNRILLWEGISWQWVILTMDL
jgi:hypothetical protein